jgi:catechol 1,2-dioxygenase
MSAGKMAEAVTVGRGITRRGFLAGLAGCRPLADAVVDVWHANAAGMYYGLEGAAGEADWQLRGRARTGRDGAYRFETILPGRYPLSPRRLRPRHIHYLVAAPGHRPVVTQLYFAGDPSLAGDPLVRQSRAKTMSAPRTTGGPGAPWSVEFDVTLAPL